MRPGAGAVLVPAISTTAWEQGLGCRLALYRDWGWNDENGDDVNDVRLAEVAKAEGISMAGGRQRLVGFTINEVCIRPEFCGSFRFPEAILISSRTAYDLLYFQRLLPKLSSP